MEPASFSPVPYVRKPAMFSRLFLLLVFSSIFLIILMFVLNDRTENKPFAINGLEVTNPLLKGEVSALLSDSYSSKDVSKAGESYFKAFFVSLTDYNQTPTKEKREALNSMKAYAQKNFPNIAVQFQFQCLDSECIPADFKDEAITGLQSSIQNSSVISQKTKNVFDINFRSVIANASNGNKVGEYKALANVYDGLKDNYSVSKNPEVLELMKKTLLLMQTVNPETYKIDEGFGFFKI